MERYEIRLKSLENGGYTDTVITETEKDDEISLSAEVGERLFSEKDEDQFTAFKKLRDSLLTAGYGMCCAGALINAVQSGMMAGSDRVYLVTLGEKPSLKDAVGIFDFADTERFPDSTEQTEFTENYFESI